MFGMPAAVFTSKYKKSKTFTKHVRICLKKEIEWSMIIRNKALTLSGYSRGNEPLRQDMLQEQNV